MFPDAHTSANGHTCQRHAPVRVPTFGLGGQPPPVGGMRQNRPSRHTVEGEKKVIQLSRCYQRRKHILRSETFTQWLSTDAIWMEIHQAQRKLCEFHGILRACTNVQLGSHPPSLRPQVALQCARKHTGVGKGPYTNVYLSHRGWRLTKVSMDNNHPDIQTSDRHPAARHTG